MKGRRCGARVLTASVGGKQTVFMERSRREKMNELYAVLQSVVPNLFPKAPRARIVDETINYIEELEETIREMEAAKKARKKAKNNKASSSSIAVTVSGKMAFFAVTSEWRPGLASQVLQVFDKPDADLLAASAVCDNDGGGAAARTVTVAATVTADEADVEAMEQELALVLP
ncbi:transcription factor bHLH13-like [Wolffia australiana]